MAGSSIPVGVGLLFRFYCFICIYLHYSTYDTT
jgi:hypothetical protein